MVVRVGKEGGVGKQMGKGFHVNFGLLFKES